MITLPLPLVSSLILGFLFLRLLVQGARMIWLTGLLGALASQAAIIALALHYGSDSARLIQPVTAMALPPLTWLAWKADGLGRPVTPLDALHVLGPALALAFRWADSLALEVLLPLTYASYSVALMVSVQKTGPDMPRGRLGQAHLARLVWLGLACALMLSALSDLGIAAAIALGHRAHVPLIVDIATSVQLFGTGLLALGVERVTGRVETGPSPAPAPSEDDHALFARLQDMMQSRRPWRDPDLTLAQLARRLSVPAKRLSVAVNLVTGENISRYVNAHRIDAACAALRSGANATEAMLDAGFVTKSNFNREFRRVTGLTPTEWQSRHASD